MATRGNEDATADVRPHAWTAAGLLLAGAALLAIDAGAATTALLGAGTLALSCVLLWYLPSFAKRSLVGPAWLARAGCALFPLAALLALLDGRLARFAAAAGLAHLGVLLAASVLAGRAWRRGVPFWSEGTHRAGDLAAALTISLALALLAAAPWTPAPARAWSAGLALAALGALTHFLPRALGRAPLAPLPVVGALACVAGALTPLASLVPAGLLVGAGAFAGRGGKRPGARLLDAAAPLLGAPFAFALDLGGLAGALYAGTGLAVFALCLLALPVVFNQRPRGTLIGPATVAALLAPAATLAPWPVAPGVAAGAALLALLALAPLRAPRRACPPAEAS